MLVSQTQTGIPLSAGQLPGETEVLQLRRADLLTTAAAQVSRVDTSGN